MAADGPRGARCQVAALYLAQDLRLSNDHRVQAAGDPEEMAHGVLLPVFVQVRSQQLGLNPEVLADKVQQVRCIRLLAG